MNNRFENPARRIRRTALAAGLGVLALSTVAFGHGGGMMGGPADDMGPNTSAPATPNEGLNGYCGHGTGMTWGYGMGPGHMHPGYGYGPMGGYGHGMMNGYGPRGMWGEHGYGPMSGQRPGWMRGPGYDAGGWRMHGYGHRYAGRSGWHAGWSGLNLSADQQQKIEKIERSHLDKARSLRTELYRSMTDLRRLMATDTPDATAVGQAFDQVSATRRKLLLDRVDRIDQIQKVLTPSQQRMLQDRDADTQ